MEMEKKIERLKFTEAVEKLACTSRRDEDIPPEKENCLERVQCSNDVEVIEEKPGTTREEIENFLRRRCLSQSFISTFLKIGFTAEVQRFMCAMGYTCDDTEELRRLWNQELKNREEIDSATSSSNSSVEKLSPDGNYLKYALGKPLLGALREITAKKPFDPVEYLGHWLLNYKIREEKGRAQRELELQLMIERERISQAAKKTEEEKPASMEDYGEVEEEEFTDTWSFVKDD